MFKKKNTNKRRKPHVVRETKPYTPFPPAPVPSKIDIQLDSGEFFINEAQRAEKRKAEKKTKAKLTAAARKLEREQQFEAPADVSSDEEGQQEEKHQQRKSKRVHEDEESGKRSDGLAKKAKREKQR